MISLLPEQQPTNCEKIPKMSFAIVESNIDPRKCACEERVYALRVRLFIRGRDYPNSHV